MFASPGFSVPLSVTRVVSGTWRFRWTCGVVNDFSTAPSFRGDGAIDGVGVNGVTEEPAGGPYDLPHFGF